MSDSAETVIVDVLQTSTSPISAPPPPNHRERIDERTKEYLRLSAERLKRTADLCEAMLIEANCPGI
jgi:hypothetical protein